MNIFSSHSSHAQETTSHVMKITLLSVVAVLAISSCDRKPVAAVPEVPSKAPTEDMATELRQLEQQEEKLRREIEMERLALEREELRQQREALAQQGSQLSEDQLALEKERTALAEQRAREAEQRARDAASQLALPAPQPPAVLPLQQQPVRQQPIRAVPVSTTGDYDYSIFYDRLSGDGTWFESPQYGYVWRPSVCVSNRGWRPYTHGSWAYTDYGWSWVSTESFGWATYHYGRWVLLRNSGWCWVPGREWAPAWVCWKSGGDYIGWAPLPPESLYWRGNDWSTYYGSSAGISPSCFSFVNYNSFGGSMVSVVLSINDSVRIYAQTNYIGGYRWNNNRAYCNGVEYDHIVRRIGRPLPRYHCDFDGRPPSYREPLRYAAVNGDRLSFHAPNMNVPWNEALRPRVLNSKPLQDEVVREKSFESRLQDRFISERKRDRERAEESYKGTLAKKMSERIQLEEKITRQREELEERQEASKDSARDRDSRSPFSGRELSRPDRDREPQQPAVQSDQPAVTPAEPVVKAPDRDPGNRFDPRQRDAQKEQESRARAEADAARAKQEREQSNMRDLARRQEQESRARAEADAARAKQEREQSNMRDLARRQEEESRARAEAEANAKRKEEVTRMEQLRALQKQQAEQAALRESQERARRETEMEQVRQKEAREAQERAQKEQASRQQEQMREAQARARQEQMREAQARAQQEQMRRQQEQMRESQERAQQEQMRRQQEQMREAQERAQQEQMRRQQESERESRSGRESRFNR
jgi:hypothetical protein